ncbi:MAG: SynChlorMet cassette radical SAM/SPASM protein ScmE [Deltaproteobacteria bacterium]|nr:SynChlorMet cassette radical SAM/SPASM protein ScmE [Deltaproteobacteria bacterium]
MKVMSTPRSVDIDITNRCNLRCKYCYHFSGPGDVAEDLPKGEWLQFFEELNRCAIMNVTIAGGEPFLRHDLRELIEGVAENRMRFNILSNGTLITGDMAAFLSSTGRCDGVQVSIDGSKPETHDACRGKGNFHKAMDGIHCLQKHGVPVDVRVTVHRHNVRDLNGIATLLLDEVGLSGFSTNAASYMGLCRQNVEQVGLSTEDRTLAMDTLLRLNRKYNGRISANAGPLAEATMWPEMELAHRNGKEHLSDRGRLVACGCVMDKIAVRSDGVIVPCTMLSHIELGRINKDDFKEIWQNHPEMQKRRERQNIPLSNFEFCQGCEYINYCTGNCPGLAYTMTGEVNHPSPDACLRLFLEDGGRLPEIEEAS